MNVSRVSLGELLTLVRRKADVVANGQYPEIGVRSYGRGLFHKEPRSALEVGEKELFLVHEGDFILQVTFAWEGAVAVAKAEDHGLYGSVRMLTFRVDETRCLPEFLQFYFRTQEGVEQLVRISPGSAGRNRVLNKSRLSEVLIPLPPVAEQRRIVAKIERLAGKIEEARGLQELQAQEIDVMQRQVHRGLINLPGYTQLSIEECCEDPIDYRGRTPPLADSGIPHLTSANIKNGRIDFDSAKFVSDETYDAYMTRGIPRKGDVIFTMEAPLGEAAPVLDGRKFSLAQRTLLLRGKETVVIGEYLAKALTSPDVRGEIYGQSTGTTVKGIAAKRLRFIRLPVPPISEQHRIVAQLDDLQAKVSRLKVLQMQSSAQLDALLPTILDRAFRGAL